MADKHPGAIDMPHFIQAKSILNKTKRRDPWFLDDYTINPYSGCSFNCLYCYIRGSKYGTHMEERLSVKQNAVDLLQKQLSSRSKKGQFGFIVMCSATDPYLQLEKDLLLTRQLLEVVRFYRFPVHIITKSGLVVRDFDLLRDIAENAILPGDLKGKLATGTLLTYSFSSLSDYHAHIFEPGATPPTERLATMKKSIEAGFFSGVSLMPLLPYISDTLQHLHLMFAAFSEAGVRYVMPATLTLFGGGPHDSKTLTMKAVEKHFPLLMEKYEKYFSNSYEMPEYYRNAFYLKAKELSLEYGLNDRIIRE